MKQIIVFTDGSSVVCGKYKGYGGFGTYFPDLFGKKKAFSKQFEKSKTGKMEVMALLYALKAMPKTYQHNVELLVISDSEYVVKTFTENRLRKWISNDWHNTSGVVKNVELWKKIVQQLETKTYLKLKLQHIKSHQVDREKNEEKRKELLKNPLIRGNMVADKLADYKRHKNIRNE